VKPIILTALLFVLYAGTGWTGAKLVVSEDIWEFGDIPNVGTVSHTFKLSNKGDAALKILSVSATCGCTTTKVENQELKPGESTGITATFNGAAFPAGGRYVKQVTVVTNDSSSQNKLLTIAATVCATEYPWGGVTPRVIELRKEPGKGKDSWKDVEIQNQTALSQEVTVLEKVGLVTDAKVPGKTIPSGGKGRVRVKVGALQDPLPPSSLTLRLDSQEGERRVSIPVTSETSTGMSGGAGPPKN
jgi:hypothetical protein